MADEPNTPAPAADAAVDNDTSNAPVELTPTQAESKGFRADLDAEIESLWAKAESGAPIDTDETPPPAPVAEAKAANAAPEPKPAETAPPAPEIDREAIIREERARIEAENAEREQARARIEAEQKHRSTYEAYIGGEPDYQAVNAALRAAQRGDYGLLERLDVVLPNGKRVSEVHAESGSGLTGLTAAEASQLLDTWDQNRSYENVMGDRKVAQILGYWDAQTRQALTDPDVDAQKVRAFNTPGEQMSAAIETTRATVTKRLTEAHEAVVKAKDAEIERLTQRVTSLTNERQNTRSAERAAGVATADRPGAGPNLRQGIPDPDALAAMPAEEAFKSGAIDRLLQSIPGGLSTRRAG